MVYSIQCNQIQLWRQIIRSQQPVARCNLWQQDYKFLQQASLVTTGDIATDFRLLQKKLSLLDHLFDRQQVQSPENEIRRSNQIIEDR
jgi:hypothetical protein